MFHDARVEVVAGLLRWHMVLFGVVEEGLTIVEMSLLVGLLTCVLRYALAQIGLGWLTSVLGRQLRATAT